MKRNPSIFSPGVMGRGQNNLNNRHHISRADGTNIWLLEYTVSGAGWVRTGEMIHSLMPGSFLVFKPCVEQEYGMDLEVGAWDHIWFCFSPRPHWHDWLNWPELDSGVMFLSIKDANLGKQLMKRMEHALRMSYGILDRRQDLMMNVLEEILIHADAWNPSRKTAMLDDRIRDVLTYLCENSARRIVLEELAKVSSLSESRLSHLFREQMGETPMQYLEKRRIEQAQNLLQMTGKTVSQVAYEVGFNNPFYFSRVFKRRMGMNPSQVRSGAITNVQGKRQKTMIRRQEGGT